MHPVTQRLIERTPPRARPAAVLTVKTVDDTFQDRVPGLAAEIAFFALLSLPPLLVTLLSGIGIVGEWFDATWQSELVVTLRAAAATMFSEDTVTDTIGPLLDRLVRESAGSVFGIGFLLTFVSASRAMRVVATAITIAYDLESTRPKWQQRIWGFALTLGAIVVGIGIVPLVLAGPNFGETLARWLGGVPLLAEVWRVAYWPAAAFVATLLIAVLYHLAAPWWTPFLRDVPGALLAMVVWLAGSLGLRIYLAETIAADAIYQPIAGPLAVLLWLYVSGFAVLLGAELNAEIEKLWPSLPELHHDDELGFVRTEAKAARHESRPETPT